MLVGVGAEFPDHQTQGGKECWAALRQIARSTRATWKPILYSTLTPSSPASGLRLWAGGLVDAVLAGDSLFFSQGVRMEERGMSDLPHRGGWEADGALCTRMSYATLQA